MVFDIYTGEGWRREEDGKRNRKFKIILERWGGRKRKKKKGKGRVSMSSLNDCNLTIMEIFVGQRN